MGKEGVKAVDQKTLVMESVKELFQKKLIPGLYAVLFIVALLVLSVLLVRRQIYF